MSEKIIVKARFVPQAKTREEWESKNPILLAGEHGVVINHNGVEIEKIGDGATPWNNLKWWKGLSAYDVAVANGFEGSEKEWLETLKANTEEVVSTVDKAVAEAINDCVPKIPMQSIDAPFSSVIAVNNNHIYDENGMIISTPNKDSYEYIDVVQKNILGFGVEGVSGYRGKLPIRDEKGNLFTGAPIDDIDCANKKYVDDAVANTIEVDLTEYIKNTDYATKEKAGVLKTIPDYAVNCGSGGILTSLVRTIDRYEAMPDTAFISKGTLNNVLDKRIDDIEIDTSGAEVWEEISNITLEEDVAEFNCQTEIPYKKIRVFVDNGSDNNDVTSCYLYGIAKRTNGNFQGAVCLNHNNYVNGYKFGYASFECVGDKGVLVTNIGTKATRTEQKGVTNWFCANEGWFYSDKLYGVVFSYTDVIILKANTKIIVEGVRA